MPLYPKIWGDSSPSGETVEELMSSMPEREVFVKVTDGELIGTGMRMLPDGSLLAPEGFSVESGSIDFGDVLTLSEAAGFLGLTNNLNQEAYQIVDYHVPKDAASDNPRIFKLNEAEWEFVAQSDESSTLTSNPLIFNYTTMLDARTNSILFKALSTMTNVRIKIVKSDVNVVLKYLPSKASWLTNTNGYNFVAGDNTIDFGDSPVPLSMGTMLTFEIRANTVALKGNTSGIPYFSVMAQRGEYTNLPLSSEVSPESIKNKLQSLASPNKLSKNAIQDAVLSVNSQFADVVLDYEDVGAQEQSEILDEFSQLVLSPNKLVHVNSSSEIDLRDITEAGLEWVSQTSVDNQKNLLGLSDVASTGDYDDLLNKPFIPSAQIQSDWNQSSTSAVDFIKNKPTIPVVSYPVVSVNTKTGAVVLDNTDVGAAATIHSHAISAITGLQTALDNKISVGATIPYSTLSGVPTIPATQVNSDWTASSGVAQILNKPTTLGGYGITDGVTNSSLATTLGGYATITALSSGLSGKYNTPTGSAAQYIRGDGTLATFPTIPTVNYPVTSVNTKTGAVVLSTLDIAENTNIYYTNTRVQSYLTANNYRKVETFLGTSDASGNFTITFAGTYSTPPDVQPQIIGGNFNQFIRVVSVSTTGCVVQAAQRNTVTLLSIEVLLGATVALVGANVSVQVTPRSS